MTAHPPCPRDTNVDGDCGRNLCPYCGKHRMQVLYPLVCAVAAAMAADVWDEKTIVKHADEVVRMRTYEVDLTLGALLWLIAEQFDYASINGDGSYTPESFLEHLHTVMGYNHLMLVENLRDLASEIDPKADERTYGKARNR
jgi:hypothetical protein